jgi:hypothetical protein
MMRFRNTGFDSILNVSFLKLRNENDLTVSFYICNENHVTVPFFRLPSNENDVAIPFF